jgi:two-component sensor histidine kinase
MADIHYQQGKLDLAINELLEIAKEQKAGGYDRICFTYDLLSGLYLAAGDFDRALFYSLETIKNINTRFDSAYLPEFYGRVAANYSVTGSVAKAVEWNVKSLNYQIAIKHTEHIYAIIYDIISDFITLGRPKEASDIIIEKSKRYVPSDHWEKRSMLLALAKCYAAVNKNDMAESYCEELIQLNELQRRQKETARDPTIDQFLSTFYINVGKYDKAEKYFNRLNEEGSKGDKSGSLFNNRFLFRLDSGRGKYLSAIKHLHDYQTAKDSIYSAAKTKQIEQLKIAYETDLKEKDIQLLTKQDQLQKNKLEQDAILRNISYAVVALLIIIMTQLYSRYQRKQRTNRLLQSQQEIINKSNHELQELNEQQKKLLKEKEWLIKEIHHRVKNNLQMAISLLNAQTEFLNNPAAINAIKESRERMQAIAIIHQKLYQVDNTTEVSMRSYITELVENIKNSFADSERIYFKLDVDDVGLDISQSVPLGLILNEAITNAVKYAYPKNDKGLIKVSLKHYDTDKLQLKIADNGKGLPASINIDESNSLGLQLIKLFSEQLEGELYLINENGLKIVVNFKTAEYKTVTVVKATAMIV